jgi:hypothetical protein
MWRQHPPERRRINSPRTAMCQELDCEGGRNSGLAIPAMLRKRNPASL